MVNRSRWMVGILSGLGIVMLTGFTAVRPEGVSPISTPAKFSLSSLSLSQAEALKKRIDDHALAEALLKQCGAPSNVEFRMISAARDCIETRTLNDAATYFRKRVAEFGTNPKFSCVAPRSKALLEIMRSKIDRDVSQVEARCKACLIC